jgi:hypothetical protein
VVNDYVIFSRCFARRASKHQGVADIPLSARVPVANKRGGKNRFGSLRLMKGSFKPKSTAAPFAPVGSIAPEYLRIPQVTAVYGLSRTHIFAKIADRTLESIHVKHPGAARGIRLVKTASIRRYLESFER